jgi:hypothetical protein
MTASSPRIFAPFGAFARVTHSAASASRSAFNRWSSKPS